MLIGSHLRNTGSTCQTTPFTRASLIALRNSGGLQVGCHYLLEPFTQGNVVNARILLHATAANRLSESVSVQTAFDNEAWAGLFDLDAGVLFELRDNRGNVARGNTGVEVSTFPWGATNFTNVTVDNATLLVDAATTAAVRRVIISTGATVDMRGYTRLCENTEISSEAIVTLTNSQALLRRAKISSRSVVDLTGASTSTSIQNSEVTSESTIAAVNRANSLSISGKFDAANLSFSNNGGAVSLFAVTVSGGGIVQVAGGGAISINISVLSRGFVRQNTATNTNIAIQACTLLSGSAIRTNGASADGQINVANSTLSSLGIVEHTGVGGVLRVYGCTISDGAVIRKNGGTRELPVYNCQVQGAQTLIASTATGTNSDLVDHSVFQSRAIVNITHTSNASALIQRTTVTSNGSVTFSGTNAAVDIFGSTISGSSVVTISNNSAIVRVSQSLIANGNATFTNNSNSEQRWVNLLVHSFSSVVCNAATSTALNVVQRVHVGEGSTFLATGNVLGAERVSVNTSSQIRWNGGNLIRVKKEGGGTLTTGGFNHSGVYDNSGQTYALTIANVNRARYLGLAAGAYAPGGITV